MGYYRSSFLVQLEALDNAMKTKIPLVLMGFEPMTPYSLSGASTNWTTEQVTSLRNWIPLGTLQDFLESSRISS